MTKQIHRESAAEERIAALLADMTITEKVGQMSQVSAGGGSVSKQLRNAIRAGKVGAVLNEVNVDTVNEMQRIAVEESRVGIPLLIGRDVIHGFRTVFPIPLGQAATWNPELVQQAARIAAVEAASSGVNWAFAPMIDISRDPRWGRIAESFGEDPYLTSIMAVAAVHGLQGERLDDIASIASCAKHFAGYGACEGGRDYNTTNIPENELRNVYLRPFKAAVDAGVATLMASFSDLDGVPASGNRFLMKQVLRDEWRFQGFVVSDYASIEELTVHGVTADDKEAAFTAVNAGINMEMATSTYSNHLPGLLAEGLISEQWLDSLVADVLRLKLRMGLFHRHQTLASAFPKIGNSEHLDTARQVALQSVVLLQNRQRALPLAADALQSLAVIGPMADAVYEQLGTWVFDGDPGLSQTPLRAIRDFSRDRFAVRYVPALENTRSQSTSGFAQAVTAARASDAVVVFLGEESILSGEAHSRADIDLPGAQAELVAALRKIGKPIVAVVMAGRPLTLLNLVDQVDAILYAWHPGTMAGPAIADLLFGVESPSGKLPVTFPRVVGQVPIYYAHKNTGRPATAESVLHIDDIQEGAPQLSFGLTSFYLDAGHLPLFPFGYGLSYSCFSYSDIEVSTTEVRLGESVTVRAVVRNDGEISADEVVQLYLRDLVGSVTRPVRELKGFKRVSLQPGESREVSFELGSADLAFYGKYAQFRAEPGVFQVWVGGDSTTDLDTEFRLVAG